MAWGDANYPGPAAPRNGAYDRWGYAWAQCTSYAMAQVVANYHQGPYYWGNGGQFGAKARTQGKPVDGNPRAGDLISLPARVGGAGPYGHVACVLAAPGGGHVWVADYDWVAPFRYGKHWLPTAGASFIHLAGVPAPAPPPPSGQPWPTIHDVPQRFNVRVRAQPTINVRQGPGTNFPVVGSRPFGQTVTCDAWAIGSSVYDPAAKQNDRRWYRVAHLQWFASAWVEGNAPGSTP